VAAVAGGVADTDAVGNVENSAKIPPDALAVPVRAVETAAAARMVVVGCMVVVVPGGSTEVSVVGVGKIVGGSPVSTAGVEAAF
jgi:hypothetical protein